MKKILVILFIISILMSGACSKEKKEDKPAVKLAKATLLLVAQASSIWQRINPADVDPNFTYNGLTPGCSSCPPTTDPSTGAVTNYNPQFSFFVKRGTSNNLMIFFMGGGACWDITNCQYHHTYFPQLFESELILGFLTMGLAGGGIMDASKANNPFRDWTIVWVPYCTADLGLGAKDNAYLDHTNTIYPSGYYAGNSSTIHHRGLVNVKLVMRWLQDNITTAPDKLFVTGISAGSYTAVMSYPLIRNIPILSSTSTKGYVLGDSGVGVSGIKTGGQTFFQIIETPWGAALPTIPPVFTKTKISDYADYKAAFTDIVQYYQTNYPNDRFAQFTAKWDKIQTWFYNIQTGGNIDLPDTWGSEANAAPDLPTLQAWESGMEAEISVGTPNYTYYIGAGGSHTILTRPTFYTENSPGISLVDWINSFVNDATIPLPAKCISGTTGCDTP